MVQRTLKLENGRVAPTSNDKANEIFEKGELILFIAKLGDEFTIQILGPPSTIILEYLELATENYRAILNNIRKN
jgi:hypothetical protein